MWPEINSLNSKGSFKRESRKRKRIKALLKTHYSDVVPSLLFFKINFYVIAEEIMAAKNFGGLNLSIISDSKISVGEHTTISV